MSNYQLFMTKFSNTYAFDVLDMVYESGIFDETYRDSLEMMFAMGNV